VILSGLLSSAAACLPQPLRQRNLYMLPVLRIYNAMRTPQATILLLKGYSLNMLTCSRDDDKFDWICSGLVSRALAHASLELRIRFGLRSLKPG
jgi:hypothetical protein